MARSYMDAKDDATAALELDSSYVKAYIHLAKSSEALHQHWISARAWKDALNALPKDNLTPSELELKNACERGAAEVARQTVDVKAQVDGQSDNTKEYPAWRRVVSIYEGKSSEEIDQIPFNSSVYSAYNTYLEATNGVQRMVNSSICKDHCELPLSGLAQVIMGDSRLAYDWDRAWRAKCRRLIDMINLELDGIIYLKPYSKFRQVLKERATQKGWDEVRSVLAVTIRSWIILAIMTEALGSTGQVAYLDQAIDILKWAPSFLPSKCIKICECCVEVFRPPFLLAARKLHLNALVHIADKESDPKKRAKTFKDIFNEAEQVFEVAADLPRDKDDDAYMTAFSDVPRGVALAAKGLYYWETARKSIFPADFDYFLKMSSDFYLKSAKFFPTGDEMRTRYLHRALEGVLFCGATIEKQLEVAEELGAAVEAMKPVWSTGVVVNGQGVQVTVQLVGSLKRSVAEGKFKKKDVYRWPNSADAMGVSPGC
ncbi:hypothetical protein WG66_004450 [Moniliophthora roreri]|nr:hypothetical protein WG66_004450 [Moniliophthora roreri]